MKIDDWALYLLFCLLFVLIYDIIESRLIFGFVFGG